MPPTEFVAPEHLNTVTVDALLNEIRCRDFPNEVARLCLLGVLTKVEDEWEGEQLTLERADKIDRILLPIVKRFVSTTLFSSYASVEKDLIALVRAHHELYEATAGHRPSTA